MNQLKKVLIFLFLLFLCIFLAGSVWGIYQLPQWAENEFGPSASGFSWSEKLNYAARLYLSQNDLKTSLDSEEVERSFQVEMGESVDSIAQRLEKEGFIRDASAFRLYLIYGGFDTKIQAGGYMLSSSLNAVEIAHALQDATPREVDFQILPGWRLEEIAAALPTSGLNISPEEFLQVTLTSSGIAVPDGFPDVPSLEGFLLPDVYQFPREISLSNMLIILMANFDAQVTPEMRLAYEENGLSMLQAVTVASIVERESVVPEEQPKIASVYINRIKIGMKLESDPTVQYALGYNKKQGTWWTNPLSLDDLAIQSPYNTYITVGMPPGPICNPGISALKAVAYPEETPYYFFRARCDGSGYHHFSETFDEHLQYSCP